MGKVRHLFSQTSKEQEASSTFLPYKTILLTVTAVNLTHNTSLGKIGIHLHNLSTVQAHYIMVNDGKAVNNVLRRK
jgi:hypothetical protein